MYSRKQRLLRDLAVVLLSSRSMDMMRLNDDYVVSEIKINDRLSGEKA